MNKRLLFIYATVFILTGLMLHLYRSSYSDMKVFIGEVNRMTRVLIKLERLDALLHFWLNNDRSANRYQALYLSPDVAYDSILATTDHIKVTATHQEERLRMDTIRAAVRSFQRLNERTDTILSDAQKEAFRQDLETILVRAFYSANRKLEYRRERLEESTALLDQWLVWMLILAGSLITIATLYSFSFLRQRERAEWFNRTLLESTNNGIVSFQPDYAANGVLRDYKVTFCNEAALKLLGIRDWQSLKLSGIVSSKVLPDVRRAFDNVLQSRRSEVIEGYIHQTSERKWLQAMVKPLNEGLLVSMYDLTAEKTFQKRLTYKINELKVTNDELQQYTYVTTHDLQEPLRKIQMFSDIALNMVSEHPGRSKDDYLRRIQGIAGHMRDLIQTLLTFTRSTDKPDHLEKVDLNTLLQDVISTLDIDYHGARVEVGSFPMVEGSYSHLRLLFLNLLSNSIKYAKPDQPALVKVSVRPVGSEDYTRFPELDQLLTYTCISVSDNGVGFQPHLNEKVFTIFQRLMNKENTPGTGIGLAISKKIVHQHNGFMWAEGVENVGATFHIFLPLEQPVESI